ncbi:MAG: curli assembly protein CsgF [Aequorivita sp.]|nr:curli assembly protein CsgF [Aequorivita sp.]
MKSVITLLFLIVSSYGFAQQLVYTPVNPSFGGDPFNYTWLLNSANAQNSFDDSTGLSGFDDLTDLTSNLDNQFGNQFGENNTPPLGTSTEGNFEYEVFESTAGLVINVLNIVTGETSQIIIPN